MLAQRNQPDLLNSLLGAFGALGCVAAVLGVAGFILLCFLTPWFVWRTKVYAKLCYFELRRLNVRTRSSAARVDDETAAALERLGRGERE